MKNKSNNISIGSWITIPNTTIVEIIARAGYDWLAIDLEHSCISIETAAELIRVVDLNGVKPYVRVSSNDPVQIKRVLDSGAMGIIVPMINSFNEALSAVSATRYYPNGNRGVGLARAQNYGNGFDEYFEFQKRGIDLIPMIEHIDSVNSLESILSVDGIDKFFIGPYDLSCSMGNPGNFNHPDFIKTIEYVRNLGLQMGKIPGIHIVDPNPEVLRNRIGEGFGFIAYGVDMRFLDICARSYTKGIDNE